MRPLRWKVLAAAVAVSAMVGWGGSALALRGGASPMLVPWTTLIVGVVLGGVVLAAGWAVRQVRLGRRRMDPTRAVRTAVLGQASAYAGALLAGVYGGYALTLLPYWAHAPRREAAIAAGLAALGGAVMLVAGVIAERWCRIGPDDDDDEGNDVAEAGVAH
ncbi:MAG: DUF3180 domain-containing protein [Demequina sp.]|uniref:DUF3180 domain-containing protein n=1 Tax=Demequina sp. TaxID=2050685 RepID=UPI0019CA6929|nr:DUF3180 domain-containing protein [Demequina sp.]MBC7297845.1 DUF3180 domain-containing protein [Demequina sp.]